MKLLLFLGIIALSVATDAEFDRQLTKLESSQFGKTLIQTIFIQLQTEDPLATLVTMMQNLEAKLEAQQNLDDERQLRIQSQCEADAESLTQIIGQATGISLSLKSELDQLNPQKTHSVANLNRKESELADLNKELEDQTARRQREYSDYEKVIDDLEQALFGINSVKTYFNNYLDQLEKNRRQFDRAPPQEDASFLQKFREDDYSDDDFEVPSLPKNIQSFAQISNHINKIKHSVKLEGYRSLIQILAQATSQMGQVVNEASDAEILTKKCLVVLKQIEGFIQKQRLEEEASEQARAGAFEELKQVYSQQIIEANQERVLVSGMIDTLSQKIKDASNEKFEVDLKISVKSNERSDREADCLTSKQQYDTETQKRNAEKSSLTLALELITSKLGLLKKQLLEKGGF